MNTEQKAKAYDEAIKKIRKGIQPLQGGSKVSGVTKGFLEEVFPELRESEDERVRKEILSLVQYTKGRRIGYEPRIHQDKMITWLEKQEEKHKTEPQSRWRPSEEQMDALAWALSIAKNCGEECAFDLRTLQEQLKNL